VCSSDLKKVRSKTGLMKNSLSYPAVVNLLLKEQFDSLNDKNVLVIGNGKLGRSFIQNYINKGSNVFLATRNPNNIKEYFEGKVTAFQREEISKRL